MAITRGLNLFSGWWRPQAAERTSFSLPSSLVPSFLLEDHGPAGHFGHCKGHGGASGALKWQSVPVSHYHRLWYRRFHWRIMDHHGGAGGSPPTVVPHPDAFRTRSAFRCWCSPAPSATVVPLAHQIDTGHLNQPILGPASHHLHHVVHLHLDLCFDLYRDTNEIKDERRADTDTDRPKREK